MLRGKRAAGFFGRIEFMKLDRILNSRQAGEFALGLCRRLPPRFGLKLAAWIALGLSLDRHSGLCQVVRANQWVLAGGGLSTAELDQRARAVLKNTGISFYNLFHNLDNPDALEGLVEFSPQIEEVIQSSRDPAGNPAGGWLWLVCI